MIVLVLLPNSLNSNVSFSFFLLPGLLAPRKCKCNENSSSGSCLPKVHIILNKLKPTRADDTDVGVRTSPFILSPLHPLHMQQPRPSKRALFNTPHLSSGCQPNDNLFHPPLSSLM